MKKNATILVMLLTLLFVTNGVAQVQLGLQAGANFGDVTIDPTPEGVETGMRTGFLIGGVLYYNFSPILGLQFEPTYVQKGAKVDQSFTEEGMTIKAEQTLSADYIDIPVFLKASFGTGPVKPYLLAGASVAFLLSDAMLKIDKATIDGVDVTSMIPSDEREDTLETKSPDFILNFGAGVIIPLGAVNIFVEGQYNLGLSDINDEDPIPGEPEMTIKTKGIKAKVGVLFPLN
jgi:hypothetical protein